MNQYQLNKEIEALIKDKDSRQSVYSQADIDFISQYEGSGGQGSKGATGEGVLYEFYTPDFVVDLMWELAYRYGFQDSWNVLEPSIATGRIINPAPDKSKVTGFEINPITTRICQILFPEAKIHQGYFESAFLQKPRMTTRINAKQFNWLDDFPFGLVIGNPPYGRYKNKYSSYFPTPKMQQIELFFMYYGLKLLQKHGLLIYLTSSNFLRNGISYNSEKKELSKIAELVDAYRLPPVFKSSQVPTDIIVFQKK